LTHGKGCKANNKISANQFISTELITGNILKSSFNYYDAEKHLHDDHYGYYVVYDIHNLLVHIRPNYPTNIELNKDHTTAYTNMHEHIFVHILANNAVYIFNMGHIQLDRFQ
jgi:hypothetical protein